MRLQQPQHQRIPGKRTEERQAGQDKSEARGGEEVAGNSNEILLVRDLLAFLLVAFALHWQTRAAKLEVSLLASLFPSSPTHTVMSNRDNMYVGTRNVSEK